MSERKRSVDVSSMNIETVDALSEKISKKINNIVDKAIEETNNILAIYGMHAKMQISIEQGK